MKPLTLASLAMSALLCSSCAPIPEDDWATITPPKSGWWENAPNADDIARLYPYAAEVPGVGGRVMLNCKIAPDRTLDCTVLSEQPAGLGFAKAALLLSHKFVVATPAKSPELMVGHVINVPIIFAQPD